MIRALGLILALTVAGRPALASCTCQCVNGNMQPLCSSTLDIAPLCPPTICPIGTPSIAPLDSMRLPPLGTKACRQAQLCDQFGNCRWQEVCR